MLKKIMLGLLLTMGVAQADVFYAEDGFVISSDAGGIVVSSGHSLFDGEYFSSGYAAGYGVDSNITISNVNGLFDFNYIRALGFYTEDIIVSVYGENGLMDSFVTKPHSYSYLREDGSWGIAYNYFYGGGSYTDVSYIYLESAYPLGVSYFGLPENISAVPEPSQWALLLLGVAAMLGLSRRRGGMTMALPA
ncbi:PEP-CTERM sorting domain-containing protein [Pseudaeromonas sp. ZJS20]|uniref:PEP-CTERM sorting domain-containing protein n=1 Tax=Pseudaeromonas aegiceratis TaxID=3153928 RepID=UPI00390CAE98